MATIELKQVAKRYGGHSVIEKLDLTIPDGSFTVLVGPSGCGKSTLLRMIAGLEEISDGVLLIGGKQANDATPVARGVAMVFQNYALYPHMTVAENIGFGLKMAGVSREETRSRVAMAAESLHIEKLMARRPSALSGGQRQRVAIGRAIVREPTVFLFDEPLSNLDAELRVVMRVEIAKLHRQLGTTMVYVTHDQIEAMTLADRIVVLRDGRIEQVGSPEALYREPANLFVAGFIGSPRMNFLRARATGDGRIELETGGTITRPQLRLQAGEPLTVGVRPEHIAAPREGEPFVEGVIDVIENLGGTRFVYATLPTDETLVAEFRDEAGSLAIGERLRFGLADDRLHVFDAHGQAIRG